MLVGRADTWNKQFKLNLRGLKVPTGRRQTTLVLQAWLRIWTRDYRKQIELAVRAALELGATDLQVQCSHHSATLPPWNCMRVFMFDCCSVWFPKVRLCSIGKMFGWVRLSSITERNRSQSNDWSSIGFDHRTFDHLGRANFMFCGGQISIQSLEFNLRKSC